MVDRGVLGLRKAIGHSPGAYIHVERFRTPNAESARARHARSRQQHPGDDRDAVSRGRRCVPDQHEPRRSGIEGAGDRRDPRAGTAAGPPDDDPGRPAGAETARRQVRGRTGHADDGRPFRARSIDPARRCDTGRTAPSRNLRRDRTRRAAVARRWQAGAARRRPWPRTDRDDRRGRRHAERSQGAERPRCRHPHGGADRKGSQRPGVRDRPGGRLDRAELRPAARGSVGGAQADRRQGGVARQDRETVRDRPAGGDRRGM